MSGTNYGTATAREGTAYGGDRASQSGLGWEDLMAGEPEVDWLIPALLPAKGRAMLLADSGIGKSTVAWDLTMHIATGKPWQGREVKQGPVYYIASENPETFYARAQAWELEHQGREWWETHHKREGETAPPIRLDPAAIDLCDPTAVSNLLQRLEQYGPLRLVVIDTLHTSLGDGDILAPRDSNRAIRQINRIREHTGATVLLVHHVSDGNKKNPYGGSPWRGGTQVRILLTRERSGKQLGEESAFQDGDIVKLTPQKLTQATLPEPIPLTVRVVPVGNKGASAVVFPNAHKEPEAAETTPAKRKRAASVEDADILALAVRQGGVTTDDLCREFDMKRGTARTRLSRMRKDNLLEDTGNGIHVSTRIALQGVTRVSESVTTGV